MAADNAATPAPPLSRATEDTADAELEVVMHNLNPDLYRLAAENTAGVRDATPCWAKLEWANEQIARLEDEVSRRDVILDWLAENNPAALELCPYKVKR